MKEKKFTPGPWSRNIKPASKYPVVFAGRNTHVAQVDTRVPEDELEGNINLIAAAPELLEALRDLLFACDTNNFVDADEEMAARLNAEDVAAKVIAKAEKTL